eukprot:CAMPEP_0202351752 /NCGR_PEP_ID=MMETSP1126-20121109/8251_1 /ASSEMBLY_ACC=CAM_ASM_000457 /TAXON_ID=3047 /ORGANISM="Dunaliella tertiolecta, Strain CCMP1320" /LENGTH=71 /DNA_ID=CAMNT_0048943891 /DNA_START=129 /DNA_END=345 /DNA_ORIENTATION=+
MSYKACIGLSSWILMAAAALSSGLAVLHQSCMGLSVQRVCLLQTELGMQWAWEPVLVLLLLLEGGALKGEA